MLLARTVSPHLSSVRSVCLYPLRLPLFRNCTRSFFQLHSERCALPWRSSGGCGIKSWSCLRSSGVCLRMVSDRSSRVSGVLQAERRLLDRLLRLDDASRFHGYSTLRIVVVLVVFVGVVIYTYRDDLRANVAEEVVTVANRSMGDEQLVKRVETLTKDVLDRASTDPRLVDQVRQMLITVILRPETKDAASQLAIGVVQDPAVRQQVTDLLKWSVQQLLADPELRQQMLQYVADILKDDSTKAAAGQALTELLREEYMQTMMSDFFVSVLASQTVTDQANNLAFSVSQGVLSNPVVKDSASTALWDIMKGTIWSRNP